MMERYNPTKTKAANAPAAPRIRLLLISSCVIVAGLVGSSVGVSGREVWLGGIVLVGVRLGRGVAVYGVEVIEGTGVMVSIGE